MFSMKTLKLYFQLVCALGILLSSYALFVEVQVEKNEDYVAFCDISEGISCTKAFKSKFGKGFGFIGDIFGEKSVLNQPNGIYGILFYMLMSYMGLFDNKKIVKLQTVLSLFANLMSVYLGHILYFKLEDMCLVCVATYLVNAFILGLSSFKWRIIANPKCNLAIDSSQKIK